MVRIIRIYAIRIIVILNKKVLGEIGYRNKRQFLRTDNTLSTKWTCLFIRPNYEPPLQIRLSLLGQALLLCQFYSNFVVPFMLFLVKETTNNKANVILLKTERSLLKCSLVDYMK